MNEREEQSIESVEFEKFMQTKKTPIMAFARREDGEYVSDEMHEIWTYFQAGWQAALNTHHKQECIEKAHTEICLAGVGVSDSSLEHIKTASALLQRCLQGTEYAVKNGFNSPPNTGTTTNED